jgi:hypothetical protein
MYCTIIFPVSKYFFGMNRNLTVDGIWKGRKTDAIWKERTLCITGRNICSSPGTFLEFNVVLSNETT